MDSRYLNLLKILSNPKLDYRLLKKVVELGIETRRNINMIPEGATELELRLRSQEWGKSLCGILGLEVELEKEEEPPDYGKIVVLNHRSYVDILVLLSVMPCRFLAKDEVRDWAIIGKAAESVNTLFVKRDKKTSRLMSREAIEDGLRSGATIAIFPEGTTTAPPGCRAFYPGSFEVATKVGAPVVPIAIEYKTGDGWLDESAVENYIRVFSREKIRVRIKIGQAIYPRHVESSEWVEEGSRIRTLAHDWINSQLIEMLPSLDGDSV